MKGVIEMREGYISIQRKGHCRYRVDPEIKEEREKEKRKIRAEKLRNPKTLREKLLAGKARQKLIIIPDKLEEKLWGIKHKENLTYSEIIVEALEDFLSEE